MAIGWWEDHSDHYEIIHHIGYQRTQAQVAKQSKANAKNANRRWSQKTSTVDSSNDPLCGSQCDSHNDSEYEMDRTGQAWITNRGTEPNRNGQPNKSNCSDEEYAASLRETNEEDLRETD